MLENIWQGFGFSSAARQAVCSKLLENATTGDLYGWCRSLSCVVHQPQSRLETNIMMFGRGKLHLQPVCISTGGYHSNVKLHEAVGHASNPMPPVTVRYHTACNIVTYRWIIEMCDIWHQSIQTGKPSSQHPDYLVQDELLVRWVILIHLKAHLSPQLQLRHETRVWGHMTSSGSKYFQGFWQTQALCFHDGGQHYGRAARCAFTCR